MSNIFKGKYFFPKSMQKEVKYVLSQMPDRQYKTYNQMNLRNNSYNLQIEVISIPFRYYSNDMENLEFDNFNDIQKQICSCIFLLNQDGYVREKYLKILLKYPAQDFMMPFLMNISADYIKEILQTFYNDFRYEDKFIYQDFCSNNQKQVYICYSRMVSYWNTYYRFDVVKPIDGWQGVKTYIKDYIGYKLFCECFGFSPRRKDIKKLC